MVELARRCLVLIGLLAVTACASNQVSFNQWSSRATLVDAGGKITEGTAIFHFTYRDGTLDIPATRYGDLKGRFATQTPSATGTQAGVAMATSPDRSIVVPSLSSQNIQAGNSYGTAFLASEEKVVLQCNIGVDFRTMGMGDAQMIGGGICADRDGSLARIYFGR